MSTTAPKADAPLTEDLDAYRENARAWLAANLEPRPKGSGPSGPSMIARDKTAEEIVEQRALQKRLYEAGYAGITWPTEYGGQGLSAAHERVFHEEARGYLLPDLGLVGGATMAVCAPTMLAHASPEFLRRHIPRILAGDEIVSQFFSDPDAGSDLAGVRTQAVRDGDRWILNGSKIWSSGAYYADIGMCLARTNWDVSKHRGLTWFAVPVNAKGVTVEQIRQINGNAEFCQEYFDDVELTDDDIIGEVDDGWTVTQTMLLHERGGGGGGGGSRPSATGVGRDLVALAESVDGVSDPRVRDLVARNHVDDLVRGAFGRRLMGRMRADLSRAANLASYGKLMSGVFDPIRANRNMEIAGRSAIAWDTAGSIGQTTSTGLLNSRFMAIAGGTTQMQRNTVGERVLGLPREPSFDRTKPFREVVRDAKDWSGKVG